MTAKIKRKLQRANEIWSEEGLIELTKALVSFFHRKSLRKILPTTGYYTKAGIPARKRKLFDSVIPGLSYSDDPDHEYALVSELRQHVQPGNKVVVIGAGSGTTTVIAANQTTDSGNVIAYEGSRSRVKQTRETISLNSVQDRCEVRHAIVGHPIKLSSPEEDISGTKRVSPGKIPRCDVLEMDCEGAEKAILENLTKLPQTVIVETHPHLDSPPELIRDILETKGYEIVNQIDRSTVPVLTAVYIDMK